MANFVHEDSSTSSTPSRKMDSNVNGLFKKKNELSKKSFFNQESNHFVIGKRRFGIKPIIGLVVLFLLLVGGVSAFILSQTNQDVRQQATGCIYWSGEPATEKSYDNRGGIRQQCINGLWTVPDDGNLDPSEIIAEQKQKDAAKPKAGCMNWSGEMVSHGSYDNRGGIRQQCVNGIWDTPDDGNTDPSEIIAQNKKADEGTCVMWDTGATVGPGTCDDRNGLLQVCRNGLWDAPKGNDCKSPFQSVKDETHQVECQLGDTTVYATSDGTCESAGKLIEKTEQLIGGVAAVIDSVKDAIESGFPNTFSSVETNTHDIECNLSGTVTFVADESVCTAADGILGGEDTPVLASVATDENSVECIVGGETFFTDSAETCEESKGSTSPSGCTANSCILNVVAGQSFWCGKDGTQTGISCDTGRECGGIPEYSCNSSGQKCIGGRLVSDQGCTTGDRFITLVECERDNALTAVNFVGECKLRENGYQFVITDPNLTVTAETDRYVPRGVCIEENREVINLGYGDCVRGDNGWEFVFDSEAIQSAFQSTVDEVVENNSWLSPGWWIDTLSNIFNSEQTDDETASEPELVNIDCSYIIQSTGDCYNYSIQVPSGMRCNDGPSPVSQGSQDGACPEIEQNQSSVVVPPQTTDTQIETQCYFRSTSSDFCYGPVSTIVPDGDCSRHPAQNFAGSSSPCPAASEPEPEMVTCHQIRERCDESTHPTVCPTGFNDGPCPVSRTQECYFRNPADNTNCYSLNVNLAPNESCYERRLNFNNAGVYYPGSPDAC